MMKTVQNLERVGARLILGLCVGASSLSLCGCLSGTQYELDNAVTAMDYHERHPIILGAAPTALDLFPVGGRLDELTRGKIKGFAERYRAFGTGEMLILAPAGDLASAAITGEIRRQLYADGMRGYVAVGSYPVESPQLASPIWLVFQGLKRTSPTDAVNGRRISPPVRRSKPGRISPTRTLVAPHSPRSPRRSTIRAISSRREEARHPTRICACAQFRRFAKAPIQGRTGRPK